MHVRLKNSHNETIERRCALLSIGLLAARSPEHAGTIACPGVPLKRRPVLIARGHRRTLTCKGENGPKAVRLVLGSGCSAGHADGGREFQNEETGRAGAGSATTGFRGQAE